MSVLQKKKFSPPRWTAYLVTMLCRILLHNGWFMNQFMCKLADLVGMDYSEIKQSVLCFFWCFFHTEQCPNTCFYIAESLPEESHLKISLERDECSSLKAIQFCTELLSSLLLSAKLHLTLFFPVQMATPGRRLCTSGRGARLRLGTSAPGGSTSSPSWAWETPLRLSGLSRVRIQSVLSFNEPHPALLCSKGWLDTNVLCKQTSCLCHSTVMCVCVSSDFLEHARAAVELRFPAHQTFMLCMIHLIWGRQQHADSITLMWWYGEVSYMKIWWLYYYYHAEAGMPVTLNMFQRKVNVSVWLPQNWDLSLSDSNTKKLN